MLLKFQEWKMLFTTDKPQIYSVHSITMTNVKLHWIMVRIDTSIWKRTLVCLRMANWNLVWLIGNLFLVLTNIELIRLFFKDGNNSLGIQILNLKLIYSRKTLSRTMCHWGICNRATRSQKPSPMANSLACKKSTLKLINHEL